MGRPLAADLKIAMTEWEKQEKLMRNEGMSDEAISGLYNFSYGQFKADRNYALHNYDFGQCDSETPLTEQSGRKNGMVVPPKELEWLFNGLMQTDNMALLKGLKTLSALEFRVIHYTVNTV